MDDLISYYLPSDLLPTPTGVFVYFQYNVNLGYKCKKTSDIMPTPGTVTLSLLVLHRLISSPAAAMPKYVLHPCFNTGPLDRRFRERPLSGTARYGTIQI